MKTVGKILAAFCAVVFVVTGVLALFVFNLEQKAFSPDTYKKAFKEQGLYEDAPALIAGMLANPAQEGNAGGPLFLSVLGKDGLKFMLQSLIPPAQLEALVDSILDSVFAFINGESDSITVSLAPIKEHLSGDAGVQAFKQVLKASPDCTAEQLMQFALGGLSTDEGLLLCNPPAEVMDFIEPLISPQIQSMMRGIPDEITLPVGEQAQTRQLIQRINRIRTFAQWSLLIPVTFLLLILLFAVRNRGEFLKWWGFPFTITGIITFIAGLAGAPLVRTILNAAFKQGTPAMPPAMLEVMPELAGSLTRQILKPLVVEGIILALVGAGMLIVLRIRTQAAAATDISNG